MLTDFNGGQPPNPRDLSHWRPKYETASKLGPHNAYGPHTSVTCLALGLLPSVALSSEQVNE